MSNRTNHAANNHRHKGLNVTAETEEAIPGADH